MTTAQIPMTGPGDRAGQQSLNRPRYESRPATSRAVTRIIEAGSSATCVACGRPVKFSAKAKLQQVIANVYIDHVWDRVEHYHAECYDEVGQPYGSVA